MCLEVLEELKKDILDHPLTFQGIQYSKWFPLPEDRNTYIDKIVDGKKFQVKTDKKIDNSNSIKWIINKRATYGWLDWNLKRVAAQWCKSYVFSRNEGFQQRAGVLTLLKTSTQLKVWFDDVLEVTWVLENNSEKWCYMTKKPLKGLQFKGKTSEDRVSTHYRYEQGNLDNTLIYLIIYIIYAKAFNKR